MKGEKKMTKIEWNCGNLRKCLRQHNEIISHAMWYISIPDRARKKVFLPNQRGYMYTDKNL
jgi:hypothetical protein